MAGKCITVIAFSVLLVVLLFLLFKNSVEKYPCSKCQGYGKKVCVDRTVFDQLYRAGVLTENSIPQNIPSHWDNSEWNSFHNYQNDLEALKPCCKPGVF